MSKLRNLIKNPGKTIKGFLDRQLAKCAFLIKDDEKYIRMKWKLNMDYPLNLDNPSTFNEKLQWLKLNDHNPLYTTMVDKVAVKDYVASVLGPEYIIPTLGVYEKPSDIDWDNLPERFVLKCTNDSNSVIICKDKALLNKKEVVKRYNKALKRNYYYKGREWPYKNVPRRIIVEQYVDPAPGKNDLPDYKFFCFDGKVKFYKIDYDRFVRHRANYYSTKGELLPFGEINYPPDFNRELEQPAEISYMISLAEELSKGIPMVRVDFYDVNGRVLFGEMTFYPAGGVGKFTPEEWDYKIGEWLQLPSKNEN